MLEKKESITAKVCALARAYHSYYSKDKVFDDYLSYDLLGKDEYEYLKALIIQKIPVQSDGKKAIAWNEFLDKYVSPIPLSRIAYTENKILEFAEKNGSCQLVICGAGLDSFAFRNKNPDIEIFELDHPNTQQHKNQKIKKLNWEIPDNVHFAPINFEKDSVDKILLNAGFDTNKRTFFSILGVSYYLTLDTLKKTFDQISRISALKSLVVFDFPDKVSWENDKGPERVMKLKSLTAQLGEKMMEGFTVEELTQALSDSGYRVIEHQSPEQIQDRYFANRHDNLQAFENVHFIAAEFIKPRENN
ncbi:class I SAM-dependent methyltransferase [Candidatus Galacturonibacter soehngenii]|uniref:class I SAM-dependent methyltransferase n=1 Tax=Candidatus Galacturonatibacter soehngenii TaxID=2307010 RepID=UPI00177AA830|nr:class I SAM-dependent methyltransferase [Candidatus Galacturonibacter soehngenii]MBA4688797.1 class I SAM-dependent methyltransferase [Candidatus Galacturonibacter soehngenii]